MPNTERGAALDEKGVKEDLPMGDSRRYHRYAEKKAGTQNKFYEVEAIEHEDDDEATYVFRWGRIGQKGQSNSEVVGSFEIARAICNEKFDEKLDKGYHEVNAMEALASAIEDPRERKQTRGLPPVDAEIPQFKAGKSEERLQKFARKYLDKLNVIRGSRLDLGYEEYTKQIESLLLGYRSEFDRIRDTKTHGHLVANEDAWRAARGFFYELKNRAEVTVHVHFESWMLR